MRPFPWNTQQVLAATGGAVISKATEMRFAGIGIDSRTIAPSDLFVAIPGEVHDGHRFVSDVLDRGVKGVMVAADQVAHIPLERIKAGGVVCVAVTDTIEALGALARFNRRRSELKVLAVTGSNGKTSTRMLMERVIAQKFETLGTTGNQNNHIGLPLTLLRLRPEHRSAILELGMSHAGEIAYLGRICEPDVGIITNVGPAHLEQLGSLEQVARAKGELLDTIRPGGTAILNADDPRVAALAENLKREVVFFGTDKRAAVRAEHIRLTETATAFTLTLPPGRITVNLATPARVMVFNALAAAAAGLVMGVPLELIQAGLESFIPPLGRMGMRSLDPNMVLVDDTYNANPVSMEAAITMLAGMHAHRRKIAVLGEMLELGPQAADLHREIGRIAAQAPIDRLYLTGNFAAAIADGALEQGMAPDRIFCGTKTEVTERLCRQLRAGDLILVKGSRGMAMETVVETIMGRAAEPAKINHNNQPHQGQRRDTTP